MRSPFLDICMWLGGLGCGRLDSLGGGRLGSMGCFWLGSLGWGRLDSLGSGLGGEAPEKIQKKCEKKVKFSQILKNLINYKTKKL